jgi:(E)-4-hydroxy-3-methylbut-2-enyl-diphosphate synthase
MTNTKTADTKATSAQIKSLAEAGCDIVRIAVLDDEDARSIGALVEASAIPVIADIHFNHKFALEAVSQGIHGLRLNPGNIGDRAKVKKVVEAAGEKNVPIRIGVNAGSLEKDILEKYGYPTAEGMVESAMKHIAILEDFGFHNIKVSLKASDVPRTIEAYRLISERIDYPLHLGVTEAGTTYAGTIKSAVGIGTLLAEGIGDTIRVSLSANPVEEIKAGFAILKSLQIRSKGVNIISCPTCGRMQIDLIRLAEEVERRLAHIEAPLNISVLGCVVNGIGEAMEADAGIAGGKGEGLLFIKGKVAGKVPEERLVDTLVAEVEKIAKEYNG